VNKLPSAAFPWIFAALMGAAMTALVTALLTLLRADASLLLWLKNWMLAWLVATPSIVWLAPQARRIAGCVAEVPEPGRSGGRETAL
jgi:hypothetical protein